MAVFDREVAAFERELGIRQGFIPALRHEDDWSFNLRSHALLRLIGSRESGGMQHANIHGMPELIADLDQRVLDSETGDEYFANVVGESLANGTWEAWLEFVPLTDAEPLVTETETQQPTRADVIRWADQLTDVYVEGAFGRAVLASEGSRIATMLPAAALDPLLATSAAVDPFELLTAGKATLRAALQPLSRAELLVIIDAYHLNPPRHSLARLTDRQLVTFIITATEVQATGRVE